MAIKVGIIGFGRAGRQIFKAIIDDPAYDVIAVTDDNDPKRLVELLNFEMKRAEEITAVENMIRIVNKDILVLGGPGCEALAKVNVDLIIDSTKDLSYNGRIEQMLKDSILVKAIIPSIDDSKIEHKDYLQDRTSPQSYTKSITSKHDNKYLPNKRRDYYKYN